MLMNDDGLTADEKLERAKKLRQQIVDLTMGKIAKLEKERDGMVAEYEEEIGTLRVELRAMGVDVPLDPQNPISVLAYNFLCTRPGHQFGAGELLKAINARGAVACVVLAPYLQSGKVKRIGEKKGTKYWVEKQE